MARSRSGRAGAIVVAWAAGAGPAWAQEGSGSGGSDVVFLVELVLLMLVGRLIGEAMCRLKQPSVMGQLLAGILLGPSLLGWIWPDLQHWVFPSSREQKAMLEAVSQFGILLLLLLSGMETDLQLVRKVGRSAVSVSAFGVAVPFICGCTLGLLLPESLLPDPGKRLVTAVFLGTALSISSIKIVAAVVRELNIARLDLGQIIVASAIMEDTLGWIIVAMTFSVAAAGTLDIVSVSKSLLGTALFLAASFTLGRRLVFWLIRWSNDNFESEFPVITTILVIMGAMALITYAIGVNTILGAFVAGILIGESPILTRHIDEQLRGLITAFFMPVFFGAAGLGTDLTILKDPRLLALTLAIIAIASIGKFGGAFVGGQIGGLTGREALALGCGMNARGSTEVIIASIGLTMGALSRDLYTMIVTMAIATTMAMPPTLRWTLSRVPLRRSEKERLDREESESESFVWNLERLLVAVDDSPNGKLAARLATFLAAERGLPTTILQRSTGSEKTDAGNEAERSQDTAHAAADAIDRAPAQDGQAPPDVTVRKIDVGMDEAVASEAKKGYNLLVVGLANLASRQGTFHDDISRISSAFPGPLAIAANRTQPGETDGPLDILVPINGTDVARRAAEAAVAIARRADASITVLYVSNSRAPGDGRGPRASRSRRPRQFERAILDDVAEFAARHDRKVKTLVRFDLAPDRAILAEAKRGRHNLIIMGVSRRPGEKLFFGDTAAAVFAHSPASILFISD